MNKIAPKESEKVSAHLDCIRGVAAFAVLLAHVRIVLFVGYDQIVQLDALKFIFYLITSFGHSAVMIFFVLSGYLVGGSAFRLVREHRWSWKEYVFRRITRLMVVLIPAIILGVIIDSLTLHLFGSQLGTTGGGVKYPQLEWLTPSVILGNLFFLQGIFVPVLGSNGPLWSLSYEFWYYLIFPVFCISLISKKSFGIRCIYFLLGCGMLYFIGSKICLYFSIWLLGVLVSQLKLLPIMQKGLSSYVFRGLCLSVFLILLALCSRHFAQFEWDLLLGAGTALLLYGLRHTTHRPVSSFYQKLTHGFAGFSYTLYLVHMPLLVLVGQYLLRDSRWQPHSSNLLIYGAVILSLTIYALAVSRFTEAKTELIRTWIRSVFSSSRGV